MAPPVSAPPPPASETRSAEEIAASITGTMAGITPMDPSKKVPPKNPEKELPKPSGFPERSALDVLMSIKGISSTPPPPPEQSAADLNPQPSSEAESNADQTPKNPES
jgi:hypothetical protein